MVVVVAVVVVHQRQCEIECVNSIFFLSLCVSSVVQKWFCLLISLKYGGSKRTNSETNTMNQFSKKNNVNKCQWNFNGLNNFTIYTKKLKVYWFDPKLIKLRHTLHSSISYVLVWVCAWVSVHLYQNKKQIWYFWALEPDTSHHHDWIFFSRFPQSWLKFT